MVKLRKITEAVDTNIDLILFNLADRLKKKGIDASSVGKGRILVSFTLTSEDDPSKKKLGKVWSENNKDKSLLFKGADLKGQFYWDIVKGDNDGRRILKTKDVSIFAMGKSIKNDADLSSFFKKKNSDKVNGKLTHKSANPLSSFAYPKDYPITNITTPVFLNYLNSLYKEMVSKTSLTLCEVVEPETKKERYFIDYDENFNRVNEGYITESDDVEDQKKISWKDEDVQKAITDTIKGLEVNKSKTTDKELIFTYNGKNGSLHLQGYMLVLDTDTDDDIPATNYPVKDKNNLTIENLLDTIKTVFSRREALNLADSDKEETKEAKKESHTWDDDIQSDEDPRVDDTLDAFYILKGKVDENGKDFYEEIVGDETGYSSKDDAIKNATDMRYNDPDSLYGVTELVDINYFRDDTFWDALDDGHIKIIWNSVDLGNSGVNTIEEKRLDEDNEVDSVTEDHPVLEDPTIENSMVFQDVAKDRFMEKLSKSLIIAPEFKGECNVLGNCNGCDIVWLYLSPSYAIDQLSNIVLPLCITGRKVTMPIADMPDPNAVFGGDFSENSLAEYDTAVQNYLLNDAPMSDIAELDLDNSDEVKAQVVDLVNTMADNYQNKKMELSDSLDLKGEALLKESRYFIVPSDTDLSSDKEVNKLTPLGYTDLSIAQNELNNLADSGRYNFDLKILDTNFSNNKEKWTLV